MVSLFLHRLSPLCPASHKSGIQREEWVPWAGSGRKFSGPVGRGFPPPADTRIIQEALKIMQISAVFLSPRDLTSQLGLAIGSPGPTPVLGEMGSLAGARVTRP